MSQSEQFFQAVLENPEDNTLRLVYADWLEECGDPRGELIRVQVELEQTPHADLYWRTLKNRETELLDEHLTEWLGPAARRVWKGFAEAQYQPFFADRGSCRLHCGFRETARMRAKTFLEHAEDIFATLPLRELHLFLDGYGRFEDSRTFEQFAACDNLSKIRTLNLEFPRFLQNLETATLQSLKTFLNSSLLQNLRSLQIQYMFETHHIIKPIIQSPQLGNLRTLDLRMFLGDLILGDGVRDPPARRAGIQALARAKKLPHLQELVIVDHRLSHSMLQPWFKAPWLEQLTLLDLSGNALTDESFRQLAALPVCGQLQTLRVSRRSFQQHSAGLQAGGCRALAEADLSRLTELALQHQNMGSGKLRTLLRSATLGNLTTLDLSGNPLKDTGANVLADSDLLAHLRVLKLESCQLTYGGLGTIARSPHLGQLEQLFLGGNYFTLHGMEQLLDSPLIERLRTLSFVGCGDLGDRAFARLAYAEGLQNLTELDLSGQRMNSARVKKLIASPHLSDLAHLSWFQSPVVKRNHELESLLHERWPGRVRV